MWAKINYVTEKALYLGINEIVFTAILVWLFWSLQAILFYYFGVYFQNCHLINL